MNAKSIRTYLRYEEISTNIHHFLIKSAKKLFVEGYSKAFFMIEFQDRDNYSLLDDLVQLKLIAKTEKFKFEFRYASEQEKEVLFEQLKT